MKRAYLEPVLRWAVVVFFAGLAGYLTARSTSLYGVGLSPDSADYVHLARDISANGFTFLSESKSILQPPFYPILLASISTATDRTVLGAATSTNVFAAAALVALIVATASRVNRSFAVRALIGVLSCFSIPFTAVWSMAWTEPVFILIVYLVLLIISGPQPSPFAVVCAGLLTAAACLTRYSGIVLLPIVFLRLFHSTTGDARRKCRVAMMYAWPPTIMIALYVLRNYLLSGEPLGFRVPSNVTFTSNFARTLEVILAWFLPPRIASSTAWMLVVFCILGVAFWFLRRHFAHVFRRSSNLVFLHAGFAFVYVVFIIWTSTTTAYDPINNRLLSPIYPSLLILLATVLQPDGGARREASLAVVSICFVVFALAPAWNTHATIESHFQDGAGGYQSRFWQESEVVGHYRHRGEDNGEKLFSNAPDVLYLLADVEAEMSPRHSFKMNSDVVTGVTASNLFEHYPSMDGALLVWFNGVTWRGYLFSLEDLQGMCRLDRLHAFSDGAIYRIRRCQKVADSTTPPLD